MLVICDLRRAAISNEVEETYRSSQTIPMHQYNWPFLPDSLCGHQLLHVHLVAEEMAAFAISGILSAGVEVRSDMGYFCVLRMRIVSRRLGNEGERTSAWRWNRTSVATISMLLVGRRYSRCDDAPQNNLAPA